MKEAVSSNRESTAQMCGGYRFESDTVSFSIWLHPNKNRKVRIKVNELLRKSQLFCKRNASTILTSVGGAGVVATTVMAVKATPKALILLEEAKKEKGEELTKLEVVKAAGPVYIPTILVGASTIACIFGANILNKKHQAALMSAYALLDNSYKDYKQKVLETYGEDGEREIRTEIAKDKFKEQEVEHEDDGKNLFYDEYSQRYFRATNETVLRAEYEVNKEVTTNFYATINELYDMVGLEKIDGGNNIGWSSSQMYEMYWSDWVDFWHEKVELEDGMTCYILHYTDPILDFDDY